MKKLTNEELKEINGGAISTKLLALIPLGVSFIVGIIDGYLRPLKCH